MEDCIFCRIARKEVPSEIVYEDDSIIAFKDINPQTPVHLLVIPKKHIPSLNDVREEDREVLGQAVLVLTQLAVENGLADRGYRMLVNCGRDGGQMVYHLHFHLLGGRSLGRMVSPV